MISALLAGLLLPVATLWPATAGAQPYPSKPVKLIVRFPAGGPADIFARSLAQGMAAELGQPVIVENISGVGGVLGVDAPPRRRPTATPWGSTAPRRCRSFRSSLSKIPYDGKKDFAFSRWWYACRKSWRCTRRCRPTSPELISYAKANPGKVNFGSAGSGSITHLAGELLKAEAKIDIVHVP